MRIVVTGALGHIGSRLIRELPAVFPEAEIVMLDNLLTQRYCSLFNLPTHGRYRFLEDDVLTADLASIFEGATVVVHLAAITDATSSFGNRKAVEQVNFNGTEKVARACLESNCALVFLSTTSVYGSQEKEVDETCPVSDLKPQSPYAEAKLRSELLVRKLAEENGLGAVVFRFGTILGTSIGMRFHTAVNKFCWQAVMGQPLTVWKTALHQHRPYLDLGDAVGAIMFALQHKLYDGQVYNVLTTNTSVSRIVDIISARVPDTRIEYVDTEIMNQLSYHVSNKRFSDRGFVFNGDLEHGIDNTIDWLMRARPLGSAQARDRLSQHVAQEEGDDGTVHPSSPTDLAGWMWGQEIPQDVGSVSNAESLPRITVVTPSYNQGNYLEATIRSVLLQGYPNLEYIVIDGGSIDNSVEIIKKYEPWLAYWVSEEDRGQSHAINKGFAHATGALYAYLNSDDFYEPGALLACAQAFAEGHPWISGRVRCWQEGGGDFRFPELPGNSFAKWLLSCPIPQAGTFWSADLHREMGPFREDLNYIFDYEFWLRFRFIKKIEPFLVDRPIAVYRLHTQSKTVAQSSEFIKESGPVREEYKQCLTSFQRVWLWGACRHRRARVRGTKAVACFKRGEYRAAMWPLLSAIAVWPPALVDLKGICLAFKALTCRKQDNPDMWPVWDE